jgi:hypothetical protein
MAGQALAAPATGALWKALVAVLSVVFVLGLALGGFAIEHIRLAAAHLPGSAASAVDRWRLEGWARVWWGVAALAVIAAAGATDAGGTARRGTRRVLATTLAVGLLVTILSLQDFSDAQARELCPAFLALVVLGHYLLHRALAAFHPWPGLEGAAAAVTGPFVGATPWGTLLRIVPVGLCALSVVLPRLANTGLDRFAFIVLPLLLAAVLMVAPGGIASGATGRESPQLRPARDLLAATVVISICALVSRTEPWLLVTGLASAGLASVCVVVAVRSGTSFWPLATALGVSVLAFAAIEETLDEFRAPQARAFAAITNDDQLVCGALLREDRDGFTIGTVTLDTSSRVTERSVPATRFRRGSLRAVATTGRQPVGRALRTATRRLASTATPIPEAALKRSSCPWSPRRAAAGAGGGIVKRLQPRFLVDREDGFWPVPVSTTFALEGRRGSVCLRPARGRCTRIDRASDVPWLGSMQDTILHPARMDRDDEAEITDRALGSTSVEDTSSVYYLETPPTPGDPSRAIQYWTFFTYDYVPIMELPIFGTFEGGSHQGDWENVGVVATRRGTPRYVWMSRHVPDDEGRPFAWDESGMANSDGHQSVFVARGSHASYDRCGTHVRDERVFRFRIVMNERVSCDPARLVELAPSRTPAVDLARAPWACFAGAFGRNKGGILEKVTKHLIEDAPRGPLWQQNFDHVRAAPCAGFQYRGPRDGATEEVLDESAAARLRRGAGRLERWFDDCEDWHKPPTRGSYLVVCEQNALRAFFHNGLETIPRDGPRIEAGGLPSTATTLPAVRRDLRPSPRGPGRIGGTASHATVYAARRHGSATLAALFTDVTLEPGQMLGVDQHDPRRWRLIDTSAGGSAPVAEARVQVVSGG